MIRNSIHQFVGKVLIALLVAIPGFYLPGYAQLGVPYLQQLAARDYKAGPENYAVTQDALGLLYVANQEGLLEFDGAQWRKLAVPNGPIRRLGLAADGNVYGVSATGIGMVQTGPAATHRYVELPLPGEGGLPGKLRNLYFQEDGAYLATEAGVFLIKNGVVTRCSLAAQPVAGATPLVQLMPVPGRGLMAANKGVLSSWERTRHLADAPVVATVLLRARLMLIVTERALYLFDGWRLQPFTTAADEFFSTNLISSVQAVPGGYLAFATLRGGLIVLDLQGKVVTQVDRSVGLQNETINALHLDQEGGLWMCLEAGLTRASLLAPLSFFTTDAGLKGAVNAVLPFKDTLYVATQRGLYWLDRHNGPAQFVPVRGIAQPTHALATGQGRLLAATDVGLAEVKGGGRANFLRRLATTAVIRCASGYSSFIFSASNRLFTASQVRYPSWVWAAVGPYKRMVRQYVWQDSLKVLPVQGYMAEVRTLVELQGNIWVATPDSLHQLTLGKKPTDKPWLRPYGPGDGLPPGKLQLFQLGNRLLVRLEKGIYEYDSRADRFVQDSSLGQPGMPPSFLYQDNFNDRLVLEQGNLRYGAWDAKKRSYSWDSTALRFDAGVDLRIAYRQNANQIWLGFANGLVLFEPHRKQFTPPPFLTLVRQAALDADSVVYAGALPTGKPALLGDTLVQQGFSARGVFGRLVISLAGLRFEPSTKLTYLLLLRHLGKGDTLRYTAQTSNPLVEFNSLPHGNYELLARAMDAEGRLGKMVAYRFAFLPYWHQTWWARCLFGLASLLLLGVVGYGSARLYSYRLRVHNQRLEKLIKQRTQEIAAQNRALEASNQEISRQKDQIEEDKKLIEEKNRDILDSINYAKRIQEALLPRQEQVRALLDEFFILYRPRDIISGDFYWISQRGSVVILAVADCTGHGVPGALMSIIGSSLLNRIVNEQRHENPAEILAMLHVGVQQALGQTYTSDIRLGDGMDICICKIDLAEKVLYSAAANRPLYLFSGSEFIEIKGDKAAVGGYTAVTSFTLHQYLLKEGDTFYMFSDGYADQFGGESGRKFQTRRFKDLLLQQQHLPLQQQVQEIERTFLAWRGLYEQVDDVLVIGVKFTGRRTQDMSLQAKLQQGNSLI